jgi:deoxyribonuclease V
VDAESLLYFLRLGFAESPGSRRASGCVRPLHYTMISMKDKPIGVVRKHRWDVTPAKARKIQEELRDHWKGEDAFAAIRTVAGLDASFVLTGSQALNKPTNRWSRLREANRAIGCVVMYRFPEMEELDRASAILPLDFPYVPGLLSFREIPVLLAALRKLKVMPDLLFCDAQGYAHPRRMGVASHLGIVLDLPTIGCAKSLLIGSHPALPRKAGSWTPLIDEKAGGQQIGAVLRTRTGVKPIYISQGHRVSLETAIRMTLAVTDGYRIPRPTRDADHFAGETKRNTLAAQASEKQIVSSEISRHGTR